MSNSSKRAEGVAEEIGGKIKGGVGAVIGNEQMEAEGRAKELQGKARQEAAKAGERAKGKEARHDVSGLFVSWTAIHRGT